MTRYYCSTLDRYVELVDGECTFKIGSGRGVLEVTCPYKNSRDCPLTRRKG